VAGGLFTTLACTTRADRRPTFSGMTDWSFYHPAASTAKGRRPAAKAGYSWWFDHYRGGGMSAKNGDKSRHQINRKRVVLRRAKIRDLVKAAKDNAAAPAKDGGEAK
jgi:hypothetical protein